VTLGAHTEISSNMTTNERRIVMRGGEAFFDVRKDAARPFVVRVGNSEVRVVGTQFNIRERSGEVEVVVREGRVNVVPDSRIGPSESIPRVELAAGGRLTVNTSDNQVNVASVDAERLTAWRTGMIRFDAVPLEDVIADVNRYTEKPLVIADDRLRRLPISGRFRVGDTEAVVFLLRERFEVRSEEEVGRVVLR
jgi:transmembrane sensor